MLFVAILIQPFITMRSVGMRPSDSPYVMRETLHPCIFRFPDTSCHALGGSVDAAFHYHAERGNETNDPYSFRSRGLLCEVKLMALHQNNMGFMGMVIHCNQCCSGKPLRASLIKFVVY
jgi:hypothetical protein